MYVLFGYIEPYVIEKGDYTSRYLQSYFRCLKPDLLGPMILQVSPKIPLMDPLKEPFKL